MAAGSVAALLLVGAAGLLWAERRRVEVTLLAAKGVGPLGIAAKAVLEMCLPFLAGAAAGWGVGLLVVPALGPSALLDAQAPILALIRGAAVAAAGLLALAIVAALTARARTEIVGHRPSWATRLPWELTLLGAAGYFYLRVRTEGCRSPQPGSCPS